MNDEGAQSRRPPLVLPGRPRLPASSAGLVVVALLVAVVVAGFGATHGRPSGQAHSSRWAERLIVDAIAGAEILVVVAIVVVMAMLATSVRGSGQKGDAAVPTKRRPWWQRAAGLAGCLLLALALAHSSQHEAKPTPPQGQLQPAAGPRAGDHPAPAPRPDWGGVGGLLVALAAAGGLLAWRSSVRSRRRWDRPVTPADDGEAHVAGRLGVALRAGRDDLRLTSDPRTAVILSYAAMEAALGQAGFPRRSAETPVEYLGRVLAAGGVSPSAAGSLTALFEEAGFGPGPVTEAMRTAALGALDDIDAELTVAAVRRPDGDGSW